jgi:hypothetical protein
MANAGTRKKKKTAARAARPKAAGKARKKFVNTRVMV